MIDREARMREVSARVPSDPSVGVEVGVWSGKLSAYLLRENRFLTLYMVDPWLAAVPGSRWAKSGALMVLKSQSEFDEAMRCAIRSTAFAGKRAKTVRAESVVAAEMMAGEQFDFVFIDADHSKEAVLEDIQAWLPLVKSGGWIGGHDYGSQKFADGGVTAAVLEVFNENDVELGDDGCWFVQVWRD